MDKQNLLFHPNAIARFIAMKQLGEPLLLSGEDKFRLLEWLEWEESTLTPQLSVYMGYLSGFDGYNDNDVCESKAQTALNLSIIDNHLGQCSSLLEYFCQIISNFFQLEDNIWWVIHAPWRILLYSLHCFHFLVGMDALKKN